MSTSKYEQISKLVSNIRNARFGQMVGYLETLIDSGIWQDFTTPVGTRFVFRPCEFDYFLAAQEIDPTVVRYAYLKAQDVDDLASKRFRLADITGRGEPPRNGDRRPRDDVAATYDTDPSGAGQRIRAFGPVVTKATGRAAADPQLRQALETGQRTTVDRQLQWKVTWSRERTVAEAIVDKLQRDPKLANQVRKLLTERHQVHTG